MNGSEKQVAWALSKISEAAKLNDGRLASEQARYDDDVAEEGEGNVARLECRQTIHSIISNGLDKLRETGKASEIIDMGVDTRKMVCEAQAELLPHKAWMERAFRSMSDFVKWAAC